jgi:hypothetical protein
MDVGVRKSNDEQWAEDVGVCWDNVEMLPMRFMVFYIALRFVAGVLYAHSLLLFRPQTSDLKTCGIS